MTTVTRPRARPRPLALVVALLGPALLLPVTGVAQPLVQPEPGLGLPDEPTLLRPSAPSGPEVERPFRIEVSFGWASAVVDPELAEGYGGGLSGRWEVLSSRVGPELSVYVANNPFSGSLGESGSTFLTGTIGMGAFVRVTPANARYEVTLDAGLGPYLVVPVLEDPLWVLGIYGGGTFSYRILGWLAVNIKLRYHLYNLAGPEWRDLKALQPVGVIDRFELPVGLSFYF